jgi:hypothetical protein
MITPTELQQYEHFRSEVIDLIRTLQLSNDRHVEIEIKFSDFHNHLLQNAATTVVVPVTPVPVVVTNPPNSTSPNF